MLSSTPCFTTMEAPGGDRRREPVTAVAPRTMVVADAERSLLCHAIIAVIVGSWPTLELVDVKRAVALHFAIAEAEVLVSWITRGELLLCFDNPAVCADALRIQGPLVLDQISFILTPWSCFRKATAGMLRHRVRVCLEGVPESDWNFSSVQPLFGGNVLLDEIDDVCDSEDETACFCLWVWMSDVNRLATRGMLWLEEPREVASPNLHYPDLGLFDEPTHTRPIRLLAHPILIHLDKVHDYAAPPNSSPDSRREITKWHYHWHLGYEAGSFPPPPPRGPVRSRLRFPEDRDGAGGSNGGRRPPGSRGGNPAGGSRGGPGAAPGGSR